MTSTPLRPRGVPDDWPSPGVCRLCDRSLEEGHVSVQLFQVLRDSLMPRGRAHADCHRPAGTGRRDFPVDVRTRMMRAEQTPDVPSRVPDGYCVACGRRFAPGDVVVESRVVVGHGRDPDTRRVAPVLSGHLGLVHARCADPNLTRGAVIL